MRKNFTSFTELQARFVAQSYLIEFNKIIEVGQYTVEGLNLFLKNLEELKNSTNVGIFPASLMMINTIEQRIINELNSIHAVLYPPKDVHYMGEGDILAVMAHAYYGNVNKLVDIMRENRVYSTDEAIKKGILRVTPPDA